MRVNYFVNEAEFEDCQLPENFLDGNFVTALLKQSTTLLASYLAEDKESIAYITFLSPEEIQELNKNYRQKDYATNVLSFPYQDIENEEGQAVLGDILICPQVVEREAKEQNKSFKNHLIHIILHSTLHLLGFDHIVEEEAEEMENLERKLLAVLDIKDPYEIIEFGDLDV